MLVPSPSLAFFTNELFDYSYLNVKILPVKTRGIARETQKFNQDLTCTQHRGKAKMQHFDNESNQLPMDVDDINIDFKKKPSGQPDDYMDGDNVDLVNLPRRRKRSFDHDFYMKNMEREADDDLHEK